MENVANVKSVLAATLKPGLTRDTAIKGKATLVYSFTESVCVCVCVCVCACPAYTQTHVQSLV